MAEENIALTVLIRCRNEAMTLRRTLEALRVQRFNRPWEVVVVDNDSSDDTRLICKRFGARVVPIRRDEFTYGRALNLGFTHSRGEMVVVMSAHSVPLGKYFLEEAAQPFDDPDVAGARCVLATQTRQAACWYDSKEIRYSSPEEQHAAESSTEWIGDYPAATCCVVRRSVWKLLRYDETLESNEDKHWASCALARGYKIRVCCEAFYIYDRKYRRAEQRCRLVRQTRSLYRITKRRPLSWSNFLFYSARALAASPLVALRYVYDTVATNFLLASIPWQARSMPVPKAGSFSEFDREISSPACGLQDVPVPSDLAPEPTAGSLAPRVPSALG